VAKGTKTKTSSKAKPGPVPEASATAPAPAEEAAETAEPASPMVQAGGFKRKNIIIIAVVVVVVWAFALNTGSTVLISIVGGLTLVLAGILIWALRLMRKQRGLVGLLQGATQSPEARRDAIAKLEAGKDAGAPVQVFARAQLMASDDPKAALALIEKQDLKSFPPAMQDDVSLLKAQLFLGFGRTQDARKCADSMNLDNPQRKEIRPYAAAVVAEAWGRTGKAKEALALIETIELPKKDADQIGLQIRIAKVFAKFAANQRQAARAELSALADLDLNFLSRFVAPQFRVHPELQKLARSVFTQHPAARRQVKVQVQKR
jgi:hypothetical protein